MSITTRRWRAAKGSASRMFFETHLHNDFVSGSRELAALTGASAGSFCTAVAAAESTTSIGRERRGNPFLALSDPQLFADRLLASMPSYPTYFRSIR